MDPKLVAEKLTQLSDRALRQRKRFYARQPRRAADIVAQLFASKGYGTDQSNQQLRQAWRQAAGPALARFSQPAGVRRGKLEITVANSMMMQEISFEKRRLLKAMQRAMPDARIEDLRFRVGKVG